MYTVYCFDDGLMDDVEVMTGTLEECRACVAKDEFGELFICDEELNIVK